MISIQDMPFQMCWATPFCRATMSHTPQRKHPSFVSNCVDSHFVQQQSDVYNRMIAEQLNYAVI